MVNGCLLLKTVDFSACINPLKSRPVPIQVPVRQLLNPDLVRLAVSFRHATRQISTCSLLFGPDVEPSPSSPNLIDSARGQHPLVLFSPHKFLASGESCYSSIKPVASYRATQLFRVVVFGFGPCSVLPVGLDSRGKASWMPRCEVATSIGLT